jgi:hypothetical protein
VSPKKTKTKHVKLPKEPNYELFEPKIPPGVIIEGYMLGMIRNMKYVDHDLVVVQKFLELATEKYMCTKIHLDSQIVIVEPQEWAAWMEKTRILNLLKIFHFCRSAKIKICVKMLLNCVHGGLLWLDTKVSIDTQWIAMITGLP